MDLKQILLVAMCVLPVLTCTHRCYKESELADAAEKMLSKRFRRPPELPPTSVSRLPARCPVELRPQQSTSSDASLRSISPWRYIQVTNDNYFPSRYVAAECLCTGCILINQRTFTLDESHNYNSRLLEQTRMFLQRELCDDNNTYRLKPVYVKVPVGCTCVRYQV